MWLHSQGYTYFTIPNLTYREIGGLVDAMNRKTKKEKRKYEEMERKQKRVSGVRRPRR